VRSKADDMAILV